MDQPPGLHNDPQAAEDMAVNAVVNYLRKSGITEQNEKRLWIKRVFDRVRAKELIH